MKFSSILIAAAVLTASLAHAADIPVDTSSIHDKDSSTMIPSAAEAIDAVQQIKLPTGVKLTGSTEPIRMPAKTEADESPAHQSESESQNHNQDQNKEQFLAAGGLGGLGGWGGWGGLGPYRFGYSCGGLAGWAYPLGFWNTFGAGLWGGGCGLGLAYGGLYYC
jgi:hypothetical protein